MHGAGGTLSPGTCEDARSQKLRMLLTHRKLLQSKAIAIENDLRGTLRNFGLKVGIAGKVNDTLYPLLAPTCAAPNDICRRRRISF